MDQPTDPHKVLIDIDRLCAEVANCAQEVALPLEKWATTYNLGIRAAIRRIRSEAELAGYHERRSAFLADLADAAYEQHPSVEADYGR